MQRYIVLLARSVAKPGESLESIQVIPLNSAARVYVQIDPGEASASGISESRHQLPSRTAHRKMKDL